jgi:hypothetical protein
LIKEVTLTLSPPINLAMLPQEFRVETTFISPVEEFEGFIEAMVDFGIARYIKPAPNKRARKAVKSRRPRFIYLFCKEKIFIAKESQKSL